jgi:prepilin-type processing-associated H-X9-DG protein
MALATRHADGSDNRIVRRRSVMLKRSRAAFSLFELLVLLALLVLLFALLLPAVAKVRQAAARARSLNNLKQLALAVHNYHDTHNLCPPGNDDNHFSVAAKLLPYIEQDNLFRQIDFKKPVTDKANEATRKTVVKVFLSPDDPQERVTDFGATNYLFNAGSKPALAENDGIFFQDSKIRFTDVLDGLSNTLMAGETLKGDGNNKGMDMRRQYVRLEKDALKDLKEEAGVEDFQVGKHIAGDRCASWMDGDFLQGTFTGTRTVNDKRPDVSCAETGGLSGLRSLTDHSNIAMCDGSVRVVNQSVTLDIWKALAGRNDGIVVPNF